MGWLAPAVISTLAGSIALFLVYAYLHHLERERFLGVWTLSWGIYAARFIFLLLLLLWFRHPAFLVGNQLCALWSGYFLLWGTSIFSGRNLSPLWLAGSALGSAWIIIATFGEVPFLWLSLPTFFFMAAVNIWTGVVFLRYQGISGLGKQIAGWSLILWGIHKADYPFLQPIIWLAPWGYMLGAILALLIALATFLVYFQKSREDLRASEARFRQLAENINEVFWVGSPDWQEINYISPAYEEVWQRSRQSLYDNPLSWLESIPEGDREKVAAYLDSLQGKEIFQGSFPLYRIVRKDGTQRWISARYFPVKNDQGEAVRVVGIAEDITAQKAAQDSLTASEERLRAVLEAAENVSFIVSDARDPESTVLEFSPGAEKIFGYRKEEIIGRSVSILHLPVDAAKFPEAHANMREGKTGFRGEAVLVRKSGELFPALFSTYPLFDDKGKMYAALGVTIDTSEQKKLEDQLRQAQKMEAIGTLAGGIAHDFNNILGVITGFTELALEDAREGRVSPAQLEKVIEASARARNLVRQILTFSRKADTKFAPMDLNKEVSRAVDLLAKTLPRMITIQPRQSKGLKRIMGDANQIEQILMNLGVNAGDAMPDGGRLIIETENITLGSDYDRSQMEIPPGEYVLLKFSDSGTGMDQETIKKIYDPFFTTKEVGKGTGLGLSTVFGIVKGHSGYIECTSEPGKGTIFSIYFPAIEFSEKEIETQGNYEEVSEVFSGSETVLLVDDEISLREVGGKFLSRSGYQVITAKSGEEALSLYRGKGPEIDLVILDVSMPGMGGKQCLKELLLLDPLAKVIISSGYAGGARVDEILGSGAAAYVPKPYGQSELLKTVREVLDQKKESWH